MKKRMLSLLLAVVLAVSLLPTAAFAANKDWAAMYSLGDEYADFFPFGTFGSQSPNGGQTEREYRTFSGNSGKMTYNFGANESRNAYNNAVTAINADSSLTREEKDAKILEAEGEVMLGANNPLANDLNRIQKWNANHPDEPKKYYRQHVIAWHGSEQNAAFYHMGFDTSKPLATREIMNARLDSYIEAMFKRYQPWDDIIMSWDIVNEALDDYNGMVRNGWNGTSWGETYLDDASNQSSAWGTIYRMKDENGNPVMELSDERLMYESEWIRVAFASARKWQKELGVHWKLYYNDYMNSSMLYEPKLTNTLKMLKPVSEAGNLDGYGMQARLSTAYPDMELLRYQIEEGLKLADEVSFSEGDLRTDFEVNPLYDPEKPTRRVVNGDEEWDKGGSGSYNRRSQQNGNTYDVSNGPVRRKANFNANDPETMRIQADYYADLMDIMLKKADEGKVGAIAIDGTSDSNTFNRSTGCQIWDSIGNEKPAFFAIIGASNRFKMGQAIEAGPTDADEPKYTADSWAVYAAARDAAEDLVDIRIYDADGVEAVKTATAELLAAIETLVYSVTIDGERFTNSHLTIGCGTGSAVFTPSTNTLTLNSAEIGGEGIVSGLETLNIVLNGTSTIDGDSSCIISDGDLIVSGTGSLAVTADSCINCSSGNDFILNSGTVILNCYDCGVSARTFIINGGVFRCEGLSDPRNACGIRGIAQFLGGNAEISNCVQSVSDDYSERSIIGENMLMEASVDGTTWLSDSFAQLWWAYLKVYPKATITGNYHDGVLTYTATDPTGTATVVAAQYTDGRMETAKMIPLTGSDSGYTGLTVKSGSTYKLFLLDSSYAPLCAAWSDE